METLQQLVLFLMTFTGMRMIGSQHQCSKQLITVNESDYLVLFNGLHHDLFEGISAMQCVYKCVKISSRHRMAVYCEDSRRCSCVDQIVHGDEDATRSVYAVDLNRSDCASSPCLNDGRCVVETTGYRCACAEQYGGIHCEHSLPEGYRIILDSTLADYDLMSMEHFFEPDFARCTSFCGYVGTVSYFVDLDILIAPCQCYTGCVASHHIVNAPGKVLYIRAAYEIPSGLETANALQFYGGHCYRFYSTTSLGWHDAAEHCAEMTMSLVVIQDETEHQWLQTYTPDASGFWWTSGNNLDGATSYRWGDTDIALPTSDTYWTSGSPDPSSQRCVAYGTTDGHLNLWHDLEENTPQHYICEK